MQRPNNTTEGKVDYEYVLTEKKGRIGYVILNRPRKLNALNKPFVREIVDALESMDADGDIRVIVIKGNGRAFTVGADLSPDQEERTSDVTTAYDYKKVTRVWRDAGVVIRGLSKPTIVQVHGYFFAGATDLFLHCDFIIAAEDAQIGCPDVKGMQSVLTHMWTYLVGPQWAKYVLLTGDNIDGKTAERIGLTFKSVPGEGLEAEVDALAQKMALIPLDFLEPNKSLVNKVIDNMGFAASQRLAVENSAFTHLAPDVRKFYEISEKEGLKAALAWRAETYGGIKKDG